MHIINQLQHYSTTDTPARTHTHTAPGDVLRAPGVQHKGRIGLARVVKEIQEMHRHHRFADSNRQAHELRAFLPPGWLQRNRSANKIHAGLVQIQRDGSNQFR